MNNIKNLVLGGIAVLALNGCASLPVATYTTSNGCGIATWNQQWVQQNVESMSWTGPCESGLTQGNGTLLVKLKNGKQREYVGAMDKGFIHGDGTYTKESGWKYQGSFLWLTFTSGRIYTADGQLLFDGLMAHNEKYNGQNITFNDQRYHQGKLYFPDGSYIDDGRYTGSAGPALGIASIDPQTGRGIVYGKYMKDGRIVYRWVEGKLYPDDGSYHKAWMQYYDRLNAALGVEIAAAKKAQAERSAKDRQETYALLGKAANAAAGGTNAAERRLLALNALAGNEPSALGSNSGVRGASGSSSSGGTLRWPSEGGIEQWAGFNRPSGCAPDLFYIKPIYDAINSKIGMTITFSETRNFYDSPTVANFIQNPKALEIMQNDLDRFAKIGSEAREAANSALRLSSSGGSPSRIIDQIRALQFDNLQCENVTSGSRAQYLCGAAIKLVELTHRIEGMIQMACRMRVATPTYQKSDYRPEPPQATRPAPAGNPPPALRNETPVSCESQSGANWRKCLQEACAKLEGKFSGSSCVSCYWAGGGWNRCPPGSGGVSSDQ